MNDDIMIHNILYEKEDLIDVYQMKLKKLNILYYNSEYKILYIIRDI
jgi:hypothetical protein